MIKKHNMSEIFMIIMKRQKNTIDTKMESLLLETLVFMQGSISLEK